MSVTYTATLPRARGDRVVPVRPAARRATRRGTRRGRRALSCFRQAVLVLRWFLDGTRMTQLARDNAIGQSTAYEYLHEGIAVLAARAPELHSALLAAKMAGYAHVNLDGTLIETDRFATPGPTPGVDLWWSGKHHNHGGNIQVITAPDGWPLWTSAGTPRPRTRHHLPAHPPRDPARLAKDPRGPAHPGRPGLRRRSRHRHRRVQETRRRRTHRHQQQFNGPTTGYARSAERGNSLLKTTFKALRNVSL